MPPSKAALPGEAEPCCLLLLFRKARRFLRACTPERHASRKFAELLVSHVRAEEGDLFEGCQRAFQESKMAQLGRALDEALRLAGADGTQCSLPNPERKPSRPATSAPPRDE